MEARCRQAEAITVPPLRRGREGGGGWGPRGRREAGGIAEGAGRMGGWAGGGGVGGGDGAEILDPSEIATTRLIGNAVAGERWYEESQRS